MFAEISLPTKVSLKIALASAICTMTTFTSTVMMLFAGISAA